MIDVQDDTVDFFITSPPYWNLKDYGESECEVGESSYEEYLSDLAKVFSQCFKKAKEGAVLVVNMEQPSIEGGFPSDCIRCRPRGSGLDLLGS